MRQDQYYYLHVAAGGLWLRCCGLPRRIQCVHGRSGFGMITEIKILSIQKGLINSFAMTGEAI